VTFEELNSWLIAHQTLVTLVATPVLSALVGGAAAWYSGQKVILSARTERIHQSAIEIARYRQAWIDALRDDLAEFSGITAVAFSGQPPIEKAERTAVLSMRIRMRMNRSDPEYHGLVETLFGENERYFLGKNESALQYAPIVDLSQDILKREWERLKCDLRAAEK
jgi:hypothetical protein